MDLKVDFWDVGQGDCSVLHLPCGKILIIDTGPPDCEIVKWLDQNQHPIYGIVLTHCDLDHVGALQPILKNAGSRVESAWIVPDREGRKGPLQSVWDTLNACLAGRVNLLSEGRKIYKWAEKGERVELVSIHPDADSWVQDRKGSGKNPNRLSSILVLRVNGVETVVWGGDAEMRSVARSCAATGVSQPKVLVGPHHGAPIDRRGSDFQESIRSVSPECVFVSAGTGNRYKHPDRKFIRLHRDLGRRACCSQLNHCDDARKLRGDHVLQNHTALQMYPPPNQNAVSCRGAMRLDYQNGKMVFDPFHEVHLDFIQELKSPLCTVKRAAQAKAKQG